MKVINLFGGPGSGKSTAAAGLFYQMKVNNMNVELVTEYAKDLVWENRYDALGDQFFVTAEQNRRLRRLKDKVDWIVTDSPLLLGLLYNQNPDKNFDDFVKKINQQYENINYLLNRPMVPFFQTGRIHTEDQAKVIDNQIENMLNCLNIPYNNILVEKGHVSEIINHLNNTYRINITLKSM